MIVVASCCTVGFLLAGVTENGWIGLAASLACIGVVMAVIKAKVNPPAEN